jgi:hypothetical protein
MSILEAALLDAGGAVIDHRHRDRAGDPPGPGVGRRLSWLAAGRRHRENRFKQ